MDESGPVGDKTKCRHPDGQPCENNSSDSSLACSHVVESDHVAPMGAAYLQTSNQDSRIGSLAMMSPVTSNDPARASRPGDCTVVHDSAETESELSLRPQGLDSKGSCFPPSHVLNQPTRFPLFSTTSTDSSPAQSSHASSSSLHSSQPTQPDYEAPSFSPQERPGILRDVSNWSSASTQTVTEASKPAVARPPTSALRTAEPIKAVKRSDGPVYPNQAFSVLQSQFYPPPYQPHPLRTRSSHPSPHSTYSSPGSSSRQSRDNPDMRAGSRTVGNTPSPSPGLYSPSSPTPSQYIGADDHYSSPFLHPSHRQAPKE